MPNRGEIFSAHPASGSSSLSLILTPAGSSGARRQLDLTAMGTERLRAHSREMPATTTGC